MSDSMLATAEVALEQADPDAELLARLRCGEETAFLELVRRYGPVMHRLALTYVRTPSVAEEVVQDAWIGVLGSLERFQGRSSLRTWLLRILANRARTRGAREARCLPFSALASDCEREEPAVEPERFQGADGRFPGGWAVFPTPWDSLPEERLLARETLTQVDAAIRRLPPRQQEVIVLRDVEGWSAEEVCDALELTAANQRVLLHRARSRVRGSLECYLEAA
jgi:RNA polymerase sigma-70 factor (ECF subfamily)